MKDPLRCRAVRFMNEVLRDLPPERSRHHATCPHCQAHYGRLATLEARCQAEPFELSAVELALARDRIFAELDRVPAKPRRSPRLTWVPRLALAALAAALTYAAWPRALRLDDFATYAQKVRDAVAADFKPRGQKPAVPRVREGD